MKLLFLYLFLVGSDPYELEVQKARQSRFENLKGESGWLNLAGLFWLKEGKNSIGGSSKNDFEFPKEHANPFLGQVILHKGVVSYWPQGAKKRMKFFRRAVQRLSNRTNPCAGSSSNEGINMPFVYGI